MKFSIFLNFLDYIDKFPGIFTAIQYLCIHTNTTKESFNFERVQITRFPDFFQNFVKFPDFSLISMTEIKFPDSTPRSTITGYSA